MTEFKTYEFYFDVYFFLKQLYKNMTTLYYDNIIT